MPHPFPAVLNSDSIALSVFILCLFVVPQKSSQPNIQREDTNKSFLLTHLVFLTAPLCITIVSVQTWQISGRKLYVQVCFKTATANLDLGALPSHTCKLLQQYICKFELARFPCSGRTYTNLRRRATMATRENQHFFQCRKYVCGQCINEKSFERMEVVQCSRG